MKWVLALLLLLARAASAEERTASSAEPPGKVVGRVWERGTIMPLPNVTVTSEAGSTMTDAAGRFTLALPAGEHTLALTASGYQPLRVVEQVTPGQGLEVEYWLEPAGRGRYVATVRGESRHEGDRFTLKDEELHQLPGTSGDPFRAISLLPGVATPVPLLPVYVIRGASPGTNGFFLDGMRVPQLYHMLLLGGVVHGRLIDRVDFYPGAYDVSFGRFAGGIIDTETRPARADGQHGEVQLRIFDISTLGEMKLPKGVRIAVGGQYGWPGVIIKAFDPRADLQYGDYVFRLDWKGLTVEALGAYDHLTIARDVTEEGALRQVPDSTRITFHRVQIRDRERVGRAEIESALVGGIDEMSSFGGQGVQKLFFGWRLLTRLSWTRFRLGLGTDGELSRFKAQNFADASAPQAPDQFGDLTGERNGVVSGLYAQGAVDIVPRKLTATLGVRADVYHANNVTLLGIDPRFQLRARPQKWLELFGGIGLYQQPPSFPVPLPGIDTFALQLGLQRAWQGAVGLEAKMPKNVSLKVTGFYQKYANVNDVVLDFGPAVCTSPPPESLSGVPAQITRQIDGQSYGMELLLRRHAGRFTGWIAYTLSRSERIYSCGLRPADFDQTHLLNAVAQIRLPWKLLLGARLYVATGRPVTLLNLDGRTTVRNNNRLPDYVQVDLRLDRQWTFRRWAFAAFIEILNLTYSQTVFGLTYPEMDGIRRYDQPQVNGFRWVLPTVGLRAHF